ncbi:MAG: M55 family metallopeptidase [Lachnospiraceae bacterium]|nr:M55 family metallopeptidase [Lachnospiraceae bacterium]
MKVYISVDIEGVTGVTSWKETELGEAQHKQAAEQMKREALAACQGALDAGVDEIWLHDSHDSGMNLWIDGFPKEVKVIRNWMGTPDSMMAGIDESFAAAICIGYHSEGGTDSNPLSHTMDYGSIFTCRANGELMSELELNRYVCAKYGVPVVFVSGDQALCEKAVRVIPGIETVPTKEGMGGATINRSPELVCEEIRAGVAKALKAEPAPALDPETPLTLEIMYRRHRDAKRAGYYPGVCQVDAHTVRYEAKDLKDFITTFYFIH